MLLVAAFLLCILSWMCHLTIVGMAESSASHILNFEQ